MAVPLSSRAVTTVHLCGACRAKVRENWAFCAWCGEPAEWPGFWDSEAGRPDLSRQLRNRRLEESRNP